MVANKFLEDVDLEDSVRTETIVMCKHFHESVRLMSERYFDTLRRHNYVTPTSYLELILTFKNLLARKREEILLLKNRYLTGLDKLQFAASQVRLFLFAFIDFLHLMLWQQWHSPFRPAARLTNSACPLGLVLCQFNVIFLATQSSRTLSVYLLFGL